MDKVGSFTSFHDQHPELARADALHDYTQALIRNKMPSEVLGLKVLHVPDQTNIQQLQARQGSVNG